MNFRRGLYRIWLLLALGCWFIGGYYAYESYNLARGWRAQEQQLREEFYRPDKWDADGNLKPGAKVRDEMINKQRDEIYWYWLEAVETQEIAMRVLFIPIGALIVYFIGGWAVRGFGKK